MTTDKREILNVAVFQMDTVLGADEWNIDKAVRWIEGLGAETDIAVLPEVFDTAGIVSLNRIPDEKESTILKRMTETAVSSGKAICFSSICRTEEGKFNRLYFIHPDGHMDWYDKRHLYPFSKEARGLKKGSSRTLITFRGIRIMPVICYDIRFPAWCRNVSENPYDLMICISSWPSERIDAWDTLLRARAIENICYVIGAGRIGDDRVAHYPGHSAVVDFHGEIMAAADNDLECYIKCTIDIKKLKDFRSNFSTFGDSDKYSFVDGIEE